MSAATTEPLIRPPRLHTGRPGDASRLELFFDLAFVVVVLELAAAFVHDLSWHGLGVFVGLFIAVWVSWVGFTLYANRFDTDDVVFRVGKLLATLSVAGCAASASDATGKYAVAFAGSRALTTSDMSASSLIWSLLLSPAATSLLSSAGSVTPRPGTRFPLAHPGGHGLARRPAVEPPPALVTCPLPPA